MVDEKPTTLRNILLQNDSNAVDVDVKEYIYKVLLFSAYNVYRCCGHKRQWSNSTRSSKKESIRYMQCYQ